MKYKLLRSDRRTVELSIDDDLQVVIKAPLKMSTDEIDAFIEKHLKWIEKHCKNKEEMLKKFSLSNDEKTVLKEKAYEYLTERTEYFAKLMKLNYTGIKITSAKKRFGSCSSKNSICYSVYLMNYPPEAIDYVVVHELAHIVHKNHGAQFYKLVERVLPDYKFRKSLLI